VELAQAAVAVEDLKHTQVAMDLVLRTPGMTITDLAPS
jgi:hypothetical protein